MPRGPAPSRIRPVPADFANVAPRLFRGQLRAHYVVGQEVLARWIAESGVEPRIVRYKPVPKGFAEAARKLHRAALAAQFDVTSRTVTRWLEMVGIDPPAFDQRAPKAAHVHRPRIWNQVRSHLAANHITRDTSLEGQAADVLRRYAPVYRCDERGRVPDNRKALTHWRYGAVVLTGAELIERAEQKGLVAGGWARIAA